jgi:hypothetical protein
LPVYAQNQAKDHQFIEGIEIIPASYSASHIVDVKSVKPIYTPISKIIDPIEKCTALQFRYALLLDIEVEMVNNLKLYGFIDDWYGTAYSFGGAGKEGIDCSGFAGKLMQEVFNYSLPRSSKEQYDACKKLEWQDIQEGDLVFFNTSGGGISHVGVYLGNTYFVHSSTSSGVIISSLDEAYYSKKFVGGGRPGTGNTINKVL